MVGIPESADTMDAAWLQAALTPRYPDVAVRGVQVEARQQWTNDHAWLRVDYAHDAGAPPRLFCKLLPADPGRRAAIAATGMGLHEALFYQHLAPQLPLRVPTPHAVRYDADGGTFALLLENLADSGCTVSDGPTGIGAAAAARALEDLAALHVRFEEPSRREADAHWVPPPPASDNDYGARMLRYGLEHHRVRLGDAFVELAQLYIDRRAALHTVWSEGPSPATVIHGDAHIGNLFLDRDRVGFLDWGMIQRGMPVRDAGYFLVMALTPEDRRRHERDLLRHYLDARRRHGGAVIDFASAWLAYRAYASYTVVACCHVVTFPENATEKRRIFADSLLWRARAAVEDLDVRGALKEVAGL